MNPLVKTPSGIIAPAHSVLREVQQRLYDAFQLFPHARDYAPGGPKHKDPSVAVLNEALDHMTENLNVPSVMFAAFHEEGQKLRESGLHGVVLWVIDADGRSRTIGNPCATRRGPNDIVGTADNVDAIVAFYTSIESINWGGKAHEAMARYKDLMGQTKVEAEREAARKELGEASKESALRIVFEDRPTRPDRTIPERRGRKPKE